MEPFFCIVLSKDQNGIGIYCCWGHKQQKMLEGGEMRNSQERNGPRYFIWDQTYVKKSHDTTDGIPKFARAPRSIPHGNANNWMAVTRAFS